MSDWEFEPGHRLGDLEIIRELGRGSFGRVYEAEDRMLKRSVALKVIPVFGEADADRSHPRILREARAIGKLSSPHIVTLFRVHPPEDRKLWVFEMEYVPGETLARLMAKERRIEPHRVREIAHGIAAALDAAHAGGVVHGDVKPGNVLLGSGGTVKLTDFGLSRILGDASLGWSSEGDLRGTPVYMAPEVVLGEKPSTASDLWSFGVVLYRMLADRLPFDHHDIYGLFYSIQSTEPLPLPEGTDDGLSRFIERCLLKDPARRPRQAGSLTRTPMAEVVARAPSSPGYRAAVAAPIGRDEEIRVIEERIGALVSGEGGALLVGGELGSGKSTLLRFARRLATRHGSRWVEASVNELEGLLRPLLEAVRQTIAERAPSASGQEIFESAADLARKLLEEQTQLRVEQREQSIWALDRLIDAITEEERVVVCVEDLQRLSPEDLRILEHMIRHLPPKGVLLLMACRSSPDSSISRDLAGMRAVTHLELGALPRPEAFRMLEGSTLGARLASEVADRIFALTHGNPLFATELLAHWEACGVVERRDNSLERGPAWEDAGLPQRFRDLVSMRLLELDEGERSLLDAAAVDGVRFDGEALAAVAGEELLPVLRQLQRISRQRGLIAPAPDGYRFVTAVTQEVVYGELAPELRRVLHLALAEHLENREEDSRVRPERLGHHWLNAGRPERARPHLLRALREAGGRQESHRAIAYADEIGLLGADRTEGQLLQDADAIMTVATCFHNMGRSDDAIAAFERLAGAAEAAGDVVLRLKCGVRIASLRYFTEGEFAVDRAELARAAELLPPCLEKGRANYQLGVICKYSGELEEAERRLREADGVFLAIGNVAQHATTLDQLASVANRTGRPDDAERLYAEAAEICRKQGRRVNAAVSEINAVQVAVGLGRLDGVPGRLIPAIDYLKLEDARNLIGQAQVVLASAYDALGDREAAEAAVDDALSTVEKTRYLPALFAANFEKAYLLAVGGELEPAGVHLERAREYARESGRVDSLLRAECLHVLILCWQGKVAEAATAFDAVAAQIEEHPDSVPSGLLTAAILFGLEPGRVSAVVPGEPQEGEDLEERRDRLMMAAACDFADGSSSPDRLRSAAELLRADDVGQRRATMRILADLFESRSARLGGDLQAAAGLAADAEANATALGHHWLAALARDALPDA